MPLSEGNSVEDVPIIRKEGGEPVLGQPISRRVGFLPPLAGGRILDFFPVPIPNYFAGTADGAACLLPSTVQLVAKSLLPPEPLVGRLFVVGVAAVT